MPGAAAGPRAEQARLRERIRGMGLDYEQITLGLARKAEQAIAGAEAPCERSRGSGKPHDRISGPFGFDAAVQASCHAAACLQHGRSREAITRAETAISWCATMPAGRRRVKTEAQAHADLAAARLPGGDLYGARDALLEALRAPGDLHVAGRACCVQRVADMLTAPACRDSEPARQPSGEISELAATALRWAIGP